MSELACLYTDMLRNERREQHHLPDIIEFHTKNAIHQWHIISLSVIGASMSPLTEAFVYHLLSSTLLSPSSVSPGIYDAFVIDVADILLINSVGRATVFAANRNDAEIPFRRSRCI